MIESHWRRKLVEGKDGSLLRVIGGPQGSDAQRGEDDSHRVMTGITAGIGIGPELSQLHKLKSGLLNELPAYRGLQAFTIVHKSSGQRPAMRRIFPPNENNPPAATDPDDRIDSQKGVAIGMDLRPAGGAKHPVFKHLELPDSELPRSGCAAWKREAQQAADWRSASAAVSQRKSYPLGLGMTPCSSPSTSTIPTIKPFPQNTRSEVGKDAMKGSGRKPTIVPMSKGRPTTK